MIRIKFILTHPILIQTSDKNILIDTGIGNGKLSDKQQRNSGVEYESLIDEDLKQLGLTTSDIDMVLMTHLHFDHASGLTDKDGHAILTELYISYSKTSGMNFFSPNIRSQATYWSYNQGDYKERLILFENEIEPYPGIKMKHTGGHSFGHSIITIESDNEYAAYG